MDGGGAVGGFGGVCGGEVFVDSEGDGFIAVVADDGGGSGVGGFGWDFCGVCGGEGVSGDETGVVFGGGGGDCFACAGVFESDFGEGEVGEIGLSLESEVGCLGDGFFNHGSYFATYCAQSTKVKKATKDRIHGINGMKRGYEEVGLSANRFRLP